MFRLLYIKSQSVLYKCGTAHYAHHLAYLLTIHLDFIHRLLIGLVVLVGSNTERGTKSLYF